MKTNIEILSKIFEPTSFDCKTEVEDLQIAITLNPSLEKILRAMDEARNEVKNISFNTVLGDSLPPCSRCGMPSHPVFGALCAMEDCIGKRR